MCATVKTIEQLLQELAPFETAEGFDNAGLLLGRREQPVRRVLVALDATLDVVREAKEIGAELIVTHHPLFFHPRKNLVEEDPEARIACEMIRGEIALLSAHTNLDQTTLSGSACSARLLGLKNLRQKGYLFIGDLETPLSAGALRQKITAALRFPARLYGQEEWKISCLAVAGGADDGDWLTARQEGAQALLTGEVRHHNALAATMEGFALLDGGHYGTEAPLVPALAEYLQNRLNDVQCEVRVYPSQCAPFGHA